MIPITVFLILLSAIAYPAYPGGIESFVLFDLSFMAMLLLALPQPRSNAYIFFACMLFLGFWMKLMLHLMSGDNFLEPIGNFSGSSEEWERALAIGSAAAIGVSIARVLQLATSVHCRYRHIACACPYMVFGLA